MILVRLHYSIKQDHSKPYFDKLAMTSLATLRTSNAQLSGTTLPQVAVFVGATAGIGRATLSQYVNKGYPLKAYIVGRNEEEFKPVLSELRASNNAAELIFLEGQISLLAETKRLTDEILRREKHVDMLFLSAGILPFTGRQGMSYIVVESPQFSQVLITSAFRNVGRLGTCNGRGIL